MIRNSFIFLERIKDIEKAIWQQGIYSWDDFLKVEKINGLSTRRKLYYNRRIIEARRALYNFNSLYFINKLPSAENWRLYDFFKEDAVYLDIETSGVSIYDSITVVGLFDGIETKTMIKGINLDINYLRKELSKYKLIVTFNGATFDLPFIKKRYPDLLPNVPNFDLKVACDRLGLSGGLKEVEKRLGINRNKIVNGLYGGDALTLWKMYRTTGDDYYLNLLVEYNEEDCVNLKIIAVYCYQKLKELIEKEYFRKIGSMVKNKSMNKNNKPGCSLRSQGV